MNDLSIRRVFGAAQAQGWHPLGVTGFALILLSLFLLPAQATAQQLTKTSLQLEIEVTSYLGRTDTPIPVDYNLEWIGPGLLEGVLEIRPIDVTNSVAAVVRTNELVLQPGSNRRTLWLPDIDRLFWGQSRQIDLSCRFIQTTADEATLDFGPQILLLPPYRQRRLLVGIVSDQPDRVTRLAKSLALTSYAPEPHRQSINDVELRMDASDISTDPLRLCRFDLLLLDADAVNQMRAKQRDSLLSWLRAGGRVVMVTSKSMSADEGAFLKQLGESAVDAPDFSVGLSGSFIAATPGERVGIWKTDVGWPLEVGLGRVWVIPQEQLESLDLRGPTPPREVRSGVAFVWNLRHEHHSDFLRTGQWSEQKTLAVSRDQQGDRQYGNRNDLLYAEQASIMGSQAIGSLGVIITDLIPGDLSLPPFTLILLVLFLYVLAIGPLDYFLLGALRLRKLTWVLFPLMTVGFTIAGISIANAYLNVGDQRKALVLRDVDHRGDLLRETRLELTFLGQNTTTTRPSRTTFVSPLAPGDTQGWRDYRYGNRYGGYGNDSSGVSPPQWNGSMPARYEVTQEVRQWTPRINRTLSIPLTRYDEQPNDSARDDGASEDEDDSRDGLELLGGVTWQDLEDMQEYNRRSRFMAQLEEAVGAPVSIYIYERDQQFLADQRSSQRILTRLDPSEFGYVDFPEGMTTQVWVNNQHAKVRAVNGMFVVEDDMQSGRSTAKLIRDVTSRTQPGFLAVVSGISPNAGRHLEDLALIDPTDGRYRCLVVVYSEDGNVIVYRRRIVKPTK